MAKFQDFLSNLINNLRLVLPDLSIGFIYGSILFFIGLFIGSIFLLWLREFLNGNSYKQSFGLIIDKGLEPAPKRLLSSLVAGYFWYKLFVFNPQAPFEINGGNTEAGLTGQSFGATAMAYWYLKRYSDKKIEESEVINENQTSEMKIIDLGKPIGNMNRDEIESAADRIIESALEQAKDYKRDQ